LHDVYADVAERVLALPVLRGRKSAGERFPGAVETLAIEALMRDGKALQAGTSHYLGDGFARAYDVSFTDRDGRQRHPHATSWGASTRLIGGVVMAHGDERGLRLPPEIAPDQAVVVPIFRDEERGEVVAAGERIVRSLRAAGIRARLDDRDGLRPGFKFHDWELKGTPVRLELGARDLADRVATLARRDTGAKQRVALDDLPGVVTTTLREVQQALFDQALAHREAHTLRDPPTYAEAVEFLRGANGFVSSGWCGAAACEERVKQETAATIRCLSLDGAEGGCACLVCGARATEKASWAQAY
jgi:prolyl-tRNA synthetase